MPKDSKLWKHFTRLTDDNGNKVRKATCNKCTDNKEYSTSGGTTNLWRHFLNHFTHIVPDDQGHQKGIMQCNFCQSKLTDSLTSRGEHVMACIEQGGADAAGASQPPPVPTRAPPGAGSSSMDLEPAGVLGEQPLPSAPSCPAGGSSPDEEEPEMEEAKYHLAKMIALRGYDPSIIDDDCFRSFVKILNPKFRMPLRGDIEEECKRIFCQTMDDSREKKPRSSSMSLAVGKAKVMESEVIYLAWYFIDDEWKLHQGIYDVSAINLACLEARADKALTRIDFLVVEWDYPDIFTVAWGITDDHSKLKAYVVPEYDFCISNKNKCCYNAFVDNTLHSVAEKFYLNIDESFFIVSSAVRPISKADEQYLLSSFGQDQRAYKEAWYKWFCFLLLSKKDVADLKFKELLCKILEEICRALKIFSASSGPTTNLCLLELFNVRKFLQAEIAVANGGGYTDLYEGGTGFVGNKDVATLLTELTEMLDKAIQASYLVWSIPLILDPHYNLNFATSILRGVFEEAGDRAMEFLKELYSEYVYQEFKDEWQRQEAQAELDRYLTLSVVPPTEGFDILWWWKVKGSRHYPTVAVMARDALAMPTCNQLSSKQTAQVKSILRGYAD